MHDRSNPTTWNVSQIVVVSILFTPIIGALLVALNQWRIRSLKLMWHSVSLSLLALGWYLIYHFIVDQYITAGSLYLPQVAILMSATMTPVPFIFFLLIPFAGFIYMLARLQTNTLSDAKNKGFHFSLPWHDASAYVLGAILTIPVGILLVYSTVLLSLLFYG